jgi:hypothetical protein
MVPQINYIELLSKHYPDVSCYTTGDYSNYNDIIFIDQSIDKAVLDTLHAVEFKTNKIVEFSLLAQNDIVNGFYSSALGDSNYYDSQPEDQLNLIGAVASGTTMPYSCRTGGPNGIKEYKIHTNAQLVQVINDGKDVKLLALQKFNTKKNDIINAPSLEAADLITW